MPHTRVWDETVPVDVDGAGFGAQQMRNKWLDIQERMKIAHVWDESQTYDGEHLDDKVKDLGSVSGSVVLNMAEGRIFTMNLTGDVTLSLANHGASSGYSRRLFIIVKQHGTNTYAITFPSNFKWHNDAVVNVTAVASYSTVYEVRTFNGGTSWAISHIGDFNL